MSEYIGKLIQTTRETEEQQRAQGKSLVLHLKMQHLEHHKVTIEQFAEKVNPSCAIISQHGVTSSSDQLGLPPGIEIEGHYIVGHDDEEKELM